MHINTETNLNVDETNEAALFLINNPIQMETLPKTQSLKQLQEHSHQQSTLV